MNSSYCKTLKQRKFYTVQNYGKDDCRPGDAADDNNRQRSHHHTVARQKCDDRQVDDGRHDKPAAWTRTPKVLALTRDVKYGLAAENQRHHDQCLQSPGAKIEPE